MQKDIKSFFYSYFTRNEKKNETDALLDLFFMASENDDDLQISTFKLAKRWQWSQSAVCRFLRKLEMAKIINKWGLKGGTVINFNDNYDFKSICNF